MISIPMSKRGEIVIPKKIRASLGMIPERPVLLEIEGNQLHLRGTNDRVVEKWTKRAMALKANVNKWAIGNALYEDVF